MKNLRWIALSLVTVFAVGCSENCESPVPKDQTVVLRGRAPGLKLVKMSNPSGWADRTATVGADGKYEFAWTGADLTGTWGERSFQLVAGGDAWVSSEVFYLRSDFEAPLLAVWNPQVDVQRSADGGLIVRYDPVQGEAFQKIEGYTIRLQYKRMKTSDDGRKYETEETVVAKGATISGADLRALLAGRSREEVKVLVEANGQGAPLRLTYHAAVKSIQIPLS